MKFRTVLENFRLKRHHKLILYSLLHRRSDRTVISVLLHVKIN